MSIVISGVNNNDKITASDGTIDLLSGVTYSSEITVPSLKLGSNIQLGNAGIITATTFAGNISGNNGVFGDFVNVGSNIQIGQAGILTATTFVGNVTGNINNSTLLLQTGGYERLRIDAGGGVQVGTSTATASKVTVYGANDAAAIFQGSSTGTGAANGFLVGNNGGTDGLLWNYENGNTKIATNNVERLRITSAGAVMINKTTSFGTVPLQVKGTSSGLGDGSQIFDIATTDGSTGTRLAFGVNEDNFGWIRSYESGVGGRDIVLAASNEKMRIKSDGKIGIGLTNPQKNLHLYTSGVATLRIETGDSRGQAWDILSTNGAGTNTGTLSFRNEAGSSYLDLAANAGSPKTTIRNGGANDLLVVDNNGYVTQPYLPSFMAYGNSSWTDLNAGTNLIPYVFPNTAHNTGDHYNTTSGVFTAPVTGVYQLNWNLFCASPTDQDSAAELIFYVQKNGSNVSRLHTKKGYGNMGDDQGVVNLHVFEKLNANDEIRLAAYAYSVQWRIYGGHTTFSGALIG